MGNYFNLKSIVSVYPASDELKSSLRYYSYDTDVATINSSTGIITPRSYGQARIMISCDASGAIILDPLTCNMHYTEVGDIYDYEYVACFLIKTVN